MSRNYANFATSIWRPEDDFGTLTMAAQWAYFMLTTQPDISAAGVLSLNVRRWSKRTKDGNRDVVVAALQELQAAGKVFYDYDTEELLIRKFVKWDGGYGNQKRRPVIERAALSMESARLRGILAAELRKLGDDAMAQLADRLCAPYGIANDLAHAAEQPEVGSEVEHGAAKGAESDSGKPAFSQVDSLSDGVSPFDGVVVIQEGVGSTSTHNPQPVPPSAGAAQTAPANGTKPKASRRRRTSTHDAATSEPNAQAVVAAFVDGARERRRTVTKDVIKQVGSTAKRLLANNDVPVDDLVNAAREMGRRGWKDLNMQLLRGAEGSSSTNGARNAWQGPQTSEEAKNYYARPTQPQGGTR